MKWKLLCPLCGKKFVSNSENPIVGALVGGNLLPWNAFSDKEDRALLCLYWHQRTNLIAVVKRLCDHCGAEICMDAGNVDVIEGRKQAKQGN